MREAQTRKPDQSTINCKAIILAAGISKRWQYSIKLQYTPLSWSEVNKNIAFANSMRPSHLSKLREIDRPPNDLKLHKSLAVLGGKTIIAYAVSSYKSCGINDLLFVVSEESSAQKEIIVFVNNSGEITQLKTTLVRVSGISELAYSTYKGLEKLYVQNSYNGDVIISYSDIIWEHRLLKELLAEKGGDIVVVIDTKWEDNYPPRRIWHDKLYAEVVYLDEQRKIKRIGEAINRFEGVPGWYYGRQESFDEVFKSCHGEIVGLFKFSLRGAKAFLEEYDRVSKLHQSMITVVEWNPPSNLQDTMERRNKIHIKEQALLGDFLEYLSRQRADINIKMLEVKDGWAEIDCWGDINLAEQKNLDLSRPKIDDITSKSPIQPVVRPPGAIGKKDSKKHIESISLKGAKITLIAAIITLVSAILTSSLWRPLIKKWIGGSNVTTEISPKKKVLNSLKEICQDIDSRPFVQQEETAKRYIGIKIEKERLKLFDIHEYPDEGTFHLTMIFPKELDESYETGRKFLCAVKRNQYPELNAAKRGLELYVSGQIEEAGRSYIRFSSVALKFD